MNQTTPKHVGTSAYEYKERDNAGSGATTLKVVRRANNDVYIEVIRSVQTTSKTGILITDPAVIRGILSILQ